MIGSEPFALLLLALLGTFLLRAIGVAGAGRLRQDTAIFRWIGCVAFAIAAGLMAKIILIPSGVLADASIVSRLGGVAIGLFTFFGSGRRLFVGLGAGLAAFLLIDLFMLSRV